MKNDFLSKLKGVKLLNKSESKTIMGGYGAYGTSASCKQYPICRTNTSQGIAWCSSNIRVYLEPRQGILGGVYCRKF